MSGDDKFTLIIAGMVLFSFIVVPVTAIVILTLAGY